MLGRTGIRLAAPLATLVCVLVAAGAAGAQTPPSIVVQDGVTQPVFGYADAIRERVFVSIDVDQDLDGVQDKIAIDIIRPRATQEGLKVPAIIDPSPYYTTLGRGNEAERIVDSDGDGVLEKFPLFYDNYFVPRGYAMILAHMDGTGASTGCPMHGSPGDVASMKAVIDWLQGRVQGFDKDGNAVVADWDNGKAGMIGKSYDGTLANGVAATGVEGLTTIVPISAIASWYDYSRSNGIRFNTNYPGNSLGNTVTNPERRALCLPSREAMNAQDGDEHGDMNPFWVERDYLKDVSRVRASVFAIHGLNDDNVRMDHFGKWWAGLAANDVARKAWFTQTGHIDPFDFRRAEWVTTIHRWFDLWLQGVPNGIMSEPRVDMETAAGDVFETYADWPIPTTQALNLYLRAGADATVPGALGLSASSTPDSTAFTDQQGQSENTMLANPNTVTNAKRVFLSAPLAAPLRISGTPRVLLKAAVNRTQTNLGAILVDYGGGVQRVSRSGDGISTTTVEDCWGESTPADDGCYRRTTKNLTTPATWRVTKGILDSSNRNSLFTAEPLVVDQQYDFNWPLLPNDYIFPAGHQIAVIVVGSYPSYGSVTTNSAATITLDLQASKIVVPVTGGYGSAIASGFADTVAPTLELPEDKTVEATGASTPVTWSVGATDDADPSPSVSCSPASGSGFALGTTTVTCTAVDGAGNSSSGTFAVTVQDTTAPVLSLPGPIVVNATRPGGAFVSYSVTASEAAEIVCAPASGSLFPIGTRTVSCTATDASGNASTGTFTVRVKGADEQLDDLLAAVTGVGSGKKLANEVKAIQKVLDDGKRRNDRRACSGLRVEFPLEVISQFLRGRITWAQASRFLRDSDRIADVLDC